jgi:hypothetical protein
MANPNPYFQYTVGLNNVGSYQASARPWVSSSITVPTSGAVATAQEVIFPKVTRFVTIRNDSTASTNELRVAFARDGLLEQGDKMNFFVLAQSSSISLEYRITKLYLMSDDSYEGSATIIAGLTQIDATHLADSWAGLDGNGG